MSKAQSLSYIRHGESIRLNDEAVLEEVRRAGRKVSNEDLMDIIWGSEAVTPKEARRRFQPIYRATHNLVELGAIFPWEDHNEETGGVETSYTFVPEGYRVPRPSKFGYKAKYEEACAENLILKQKLAAAEFVACDSCAFICDNMLCRPCQAKKTKKVQLAA